MIPNSHSSTGTVLSATGGFASVSCPACGDTLARRAHRDGLAEKMFSVLYVYPFRCQSCRHRFLALQWGVRYQRAQQLALSQSKGRREEGRQSPAGQSLSLQ